MLAKVADYLDGKKTLIVTAFGGTFNILVWTGRIKNIGQDGVTLINTALMGLAAYCRMLAKTSGVLAAPPTPQDPIPPPSQPPPA